MFFRREKPRVYTFAEQLERLRQAGFQVSETGTSTARVVRNGCAADIRQQADGQMKIEDVGVLVGGELAALIELGYQKIWRTPSGVQAPALAHHLQAMHEFTEDLRETLGLPSLYNESLGTVNDAHLYDRLAGRDQGMDKRPPRAA